MDKYGLIGYPLGHSFSKDFFNEKFAAENIDAEYINFEIPSINDFMQVVNENPDLKGLNVTIPYKEVVIPFLDELDVETAGKIGAVNVIKFIDCIYHTNHSSLEEYFLLLIFYHIHPGLSYSLYLFNSLFNKYL